MARPSTRRRRLRFVTFVALASLLLLEVLLQIAAFAVWLSGPAPPTVEATGNVILCVGDSWTEGMGTSDATRFAYPVVLGNLLAASSARPWHVINGGKAGQNSRDVLSRLPSQLRDHRPRVVCVLVAGNDYWTLPAEVTEVVAEEPTSYRFRWRIPRLFRWAIGAMQTRGAAAAMTAYKAGPEWAKRPVVWPTPKIAAPQPWAKVEAAQKSTAEARRLMGIGETAAAAQTFLAAREACPDDPETLGNLVTVHLKLGSPDEAKRYLGMLEAMWKAQPSPWVGRVLCGAYHACTRPAEVLALSGPLLAANPEDPELWWYQAVAQHYIDEPTQALDSIRECRRRWDAPTVHGWVETHVLHKLGRSREAVESIFRGYVVCNDADWAKSQLAIVVGKSLTAEEANALLRSFACPDDVKKRLDLLVQEVAASNDGAEAARVLTAHLLKIATLIRKAGAVPVFLNYPLPLWSDRYCGPLESVAEEIDIPFLDVAAGFMKRLGSRSLEEVLSADGHVIDEGYRMMAECVAEGLEPLLRSLK